MNRFLFLSQGRCLNIEQVVFVEPSEARRDVLIAEPCLRVHTTAIGNDGISLCIDLFDDDISRMNDFLQINAINSPITTKKK